MSPSFNNQQKDLDTDKHKGHGLIKKNLIKSNINNKILIVL